MTIQSPRASGWGPGRVAVVIVALSVGFVGVWAFSGPSVTEVPGTQSRPLPYRPRKSLETGGASSMIARLNWDPDASLEALADTWRGAGYRYIETLDRSLAQTRDDRKKPELLIFKAIMYNYEGEPARAYDVLQQVRSLVEADTGLAAEWLYTIIFQQGVTALRRGETENCVRCRGGSACILPIALSAVHTKPAGSRLAIEHFTEYLQQFPADLGIRWLLNLAHMTLGEYPAKAGTGHLQKGHGVACGDWARNGSVDIFIETGGSVPGDRYHNVLFHNPGQGNNWLTVKLVGTKTNRAAIGARIKVVTDGENPLTVHRHVSSGSSFGANPLQQTIGLGKAGRVARLEIHWPTSGKTQVFENVAANQAIEVTEFATEYHKLDWKPIPIPK